MENLKYSKSRVLHQVAIWEISIFDKEYPKNLKNIYDPPMKLYVAGNYNILNDFKIAIIGCRDYTMYGKKSATYFAKKLAENGAIIISGLARRYR